jgi:hypothetical protein
VAAAFCRAAAFFSFMIYEWQSSNFARLTEEYMYGAPPARKPISEQILT